MSENQLINQMMRKIPDALYLRIKYFVRTHKFLHLKNPKTFNEKLQWLKIYYRKPVLSKLVDKYEVKEYVAKCIGEEHIIPTIGVWECVEDIDFSSLPDSFVLKCTHNSGGLVVCKNKAEFDPNSAKKRISRSLNGNYYWHGREWPYKNVPKRIIAEPYISDNIHADLPDYKIFCFSGKPKVILVCGDRYQPTGLTEDFYDIEWNHLDIKRPTHANAKAGYSKPAVLPEMLSLAEKLANDLPFARIDFYIVNKTIYFGEITLYPASGLTPFVPEKWDEVFGSWINITEEK